MSMVGLGVLAGCEDDRRYTTTQPRAVAAGVCDSLVHETTSLADEYTFDQDCAVDYLRTAGCDFGLDPNEDGERIASSAIEDMHNDPANCTRGLSCSGCEDGDSLESVGTCAELARFSHFTESEWRDLQHQCPVQQQPDPDGCAIEGVQFSADEMECAFQFFSGMTCEECFDLFDSRVCEDAFNDEDVCRRGAMCTGCDDGDSRDNGVSCEEIAGYSYFGPVAAGVLLDHVLAYPCEEACEPACNGRTCGDDGCGGTCGACADDETCDNQGLCSPAGCTIEGTYFEDWQVTCSQTFFENATCDECNAVLDSRTCEDAIDDAAACQIGGTCTGCDDGDTRDDGVTCEEIAAYSYFGAAAGQALFEYVNADPSCGEPDLVVEGIPLTQEQAAAILVTANGASQHQLDEEAGLDARAATNIVETRPLATIEELAAVSYVGATAIGLLRDYAEIWEAPEEPEEPDPDPDAGCDAITVATHANADVTDFARLIELGTMLDWPAYELHSVQAAGCPTFMDDVATQDEMLWALWDQTYYWNRDDVPAHMLDNGAWTTGGSQFQSALARALVVLGERIDDGDWDPDATPEGADLYARRQALVDAMSAGVIADPGNYVEIFMGIEACECSEEAVGLVNLTDLTVIIVHQTPRC